MKRAKPYRILYLISAFFIILAGCSSSNDSGGGNPTVSLGYHTYSESGSGLVLKIPDSLMVSQKDIEDIYDEAVYVTHCYTTNGQPVDIVLAETCILFDYFYLYPQYFPTSLNDISSPEEYVTYLESYDPFTYYFSPEDFEQILSYMEGQSAVIGLFVECDGQTVTDQTPLIIEDISPFSRAWINGFQKGDKIIQIDGNSISGMDLTAVDTLFPTEEGETVVITVERNGVEITIDTAAEENISFLISGDIAYLNVRTFTEITAEQIKLDFEELEIQAGGTINKLILDLRDNNGGSQVGMLELIDYLINNDTGVNPIMTISGPAYTDETKYLGMQYDYNIGSFNKSQFVLLIDKGSASASEVVSAALKYYGTATLIGENTYGKGIGQTIVELLDASGVVIPSLQVLPPSGISYHGIGVSPDYQIYTQPKSFQEDPAMDAAIELLNTGTITLVDLDSIARKPTEWTGNYIDPLFDSILNKFVHGH